MIPLFYDFFYRLCYSKNTRLYHVVRLSPVGPRGYPDRLQYQHDRFKDLVLGFLGLTDLALSEHKSPPVRSSEHISKNVESPILESELLDFLKAVDPRFWGPVGL